MLKTCLIFALLAAVSLGQEAPVDPANCTLALVLEGFFPAGSKGERRPLPLYFAVRDGKVRHGFGSAPKWNTTAHLVDSSGLTYTPAGDVKGTLQITLQPDPWVPVDQHPIKVTAEVEDGRYKSQFLGEAVTGVCQMKTSAPAAVDWRNATYELIFPGVLLGGKSDYQRRVALRFTTRDGAVAAREFGQVAMNNRPFDWQPLAEADVQVTEDGISGHATISFRHLDGVGGGPLAHRLEWQGLRVQTLVGGSYRERVSLANAPEVEKSGALKGTIGAAAKAEAGFWPKNDAPWWQAVPGFQPVAPGEHPRLLFRRADLPALRRRAETPGGREILARLKATLGGGEEMPSAYSASTKAYDTAAAKPKAPLPEGAYTLSHAAGFGFLYQLTGEARYAALGRECFAKALAGQRDRDDRYSFRAPGGDLRAGPTLAWYALAYDLCYDGWDEAFRREAALALQDYDDPLGGEWSKPEGVSMKEMAFSPKHMPASNHWGSTLGAGMAVMAVVGDPGTDEAKLLRYLAAFEENAVRLLANGFGDGGFFAEGPGPAHIASNPAAVPFFQALKVSQGRDYIDSGRPNVPALTTHWIYELIPGPGGKPFYPCRKPSTYGSEDFLSGNGGMSHGGWFSQGFGAIPEREKPALLWIYQHFVAKADEERRDTAKYPHRAVLAFLNWPLELEEKNPADLLPRTHVDRVHNWFVFRNRWQDERDTVVSAWFGGGPEGHIGLGGNDVMIWSLGQRLRLSLPRGAATYYEAKPDGSGVVTAGGVGLGVDFSGASGAQVLVVRASTDERSESIKTGPVVSLTRLQAGGYHYAILALGDTLPVPEVAGDRVKIGAQTVWFDGTRLHFSQP